MNYLVEWEGVYIINCYYIASVFTNTLGLSKKVNTFSKQVPPDVLDLTFTQAKYSGS